MMIQICSAHVSPPSWNWNEQSREMDNDSNHKDIWWPLEIYWLLEISLASIFRLSICCIFWSTFSTLSFRLLNHCSSEMHLSKLVSKCYTNRGSEMSFPSLNLKGASMDLLLFTDTPLGSGDSDLCLILLLILTKDKQNSILDNT